MPSKKQEPREGYRLVITPWITRNGKRIYPKRAKFFAFYVKDDKDEKDEKKAA